MPNQKLNQELINAILEQVKQAMPSIIASVVSSEQPKAKAQLSSVKSEINMDLLKNAIWYSEEYFPLKDIYFEYLIEKYKDNEFIVDYLKMCARSNKIKKAAIELLMEV